MSIKSDIYQIYYFGMIKEVVVSELNICPAFHYKDLYSDGVKKRKKPKGKNNFRRR